MSTNLKFIVLYDGDFEHENNEWKWRGNETTSLQVPSDITLPRLVARLMEKLHIRDPSTQIELKFKIPNRNVPPMKMLDQEDLNQYIELHMEAELFLTLRKTEVPNGLHIARNTEMEDHTFVAKKGIDHLFLEAQHRWLENAEICEILQNHTKIGLTPDPPNKPASGSLLLFDRKVLRHFRKDGHNWRKKKDGKTVSEANEKLKIEGVDVLRCYYAHGEEDQDFQRRSYWMLEEVLSHMVLVHYRDVKANRTNFNRIRESEVIPDSQNPRENSHTSEFDISVSPEIRPSSYEGTLQVVDSASLNRGHASAFENAETGYCYQKSPGFQSFDNVQQPMVQKIRDGSIPNCDDPISGRYFDWEKLLRSLFGDKGCAPIDGMNSEEVMVSFAECSNRSGDDSLPTSLKRKKACDGGAQQPTVKKAFQPSDDPVEVVLPPVNVGGSPSHVALENDGSPLPDFKFAPCRGLFRDEGG